MARKADGTSEGTALVTLQQAAAVTGVPYATLRDLTLSGHLRRVQLGESRRIWVRRADLDRMIANGTAAA